MYSRAPVNESYVTTPPLKQLTRFHRFRVSWLPTIFNCLAQVEDYDADYGRRTEVARAVSHGRILFFLRDSLYADTQGCVKLNVFFVASSRATRFNACSSRLHI